VFVTWFDGVQCSVCGDQAITNDRVLGTHIENNTRYVLGFFNVCDKDACVLAIKEEIELRFTMDDMEGNVWFSENVNECRFREIVANT
jgi:hypothetical protein